eukprot:GHUV01015571.1.p1 GENE.GHUV01015571.1~~GHUV01015571.1.p1  ORF type:complete len:451 (+),score=128.88 GHUV01015571.1:292-1644(+)
MAASSTALRGLSSRSGTATRGCVQHSRVPPVPRLQQHRSKQQHAGLPDLQQHNESSRTAIIAAAGRRRRQEPSDSAPPDDEPELDMDDVMFHPEGEGDDEDELPPEDEAEDDAELDWEEDDEDFQEEEDEEFEEAEEGAVEGEEEAWDAALADFDTALDAPTAAAEVEEPTAPSKEEQDRQKALAMVRFDEVDSEATVQVEEPPAVEPWRKKTFDEQTALLSREDKETLTRNIQGYAVFPMEFSDLLVSELPDGRMVLADCFIRDHFDDAYKRPTVDDDVSQTPTHYQLIPWEHTKTGDFLKRIDPVVALQKMYFVAVADPTDINFQCDFSEIYSFDGKLDRFSAHKIKTLGEEPIKEPVMRIREDGIFIEDAWRVPGVAAVAEGFAGPPEHQYIDWGDEEFDIRDYVKMGLWGQPGGVLADAQVVGSVCCTARPSNWRSLTLSHPPVPL